MNKWFQQHIIQRAAGSDIGVEKDFKGGVDLVKRKGLSRSQNESIPPCGYFIFWLNWNVKKKLETKFQGIVGNHNPT